MRYFQTGRTVSDYKRYRPAYFDRVGDLIDRHVPGLHVESALDVGCGFGNSTLMLKRFADAVVGLDGSAAMLAEAIGDERVRYRQGSVEEAGLFGAGSFGLITASSAWHWFDQRQALNNFQVWLVPGGHLALYNHWFTLQMVGNAEFAERLSQTHYRDYPAPPRNIRNPVDVAGESAWQTVFVESFDDVHTYGLEDFCRYLMSQSNVTAVTETNPDAYDDIYQGLVRALAPEFADRERQMMFRARVEMYRLG